MKSPEAIKLALVCGSGVPVPCKECSYQNVADHNCGAESSADALDYIEQLEAQVPKWISVEERLPDWGEVLVCTIGNWVGVAWHHGSGRFETASGLRLTVDGVLRVSHWMPLPEPPVEV